MSENIKKLGITETIGEGFGIGIKNIGPIAVNFLLWLVTFWIPYINVGTTIGLSAGIIIKLSKGEKISHTEIFDPSYRKYMGEFFLVIGLVCLGWSIGTLFFVIPGIIICIAWYFAPMLIIDKGKNSIKAIALSDKITYGNKWRIFWIVTIPVLIFTVVQTLLALFGLHIGWYGRPFINIIIFISLVVEVILILGITASMYKQLAENA